LGYKKSVSQFQNFVAFQIVEAGKSSAAQQFIGKHVGDGFDLPERSRLGA